MSKASTGTEAGNLYYEEKGAGPPILLIPQAGATASTWGPFADELAQFGRVIAYDRRGYRRSGGAPVGSIPVHTADAAALLDKLGASRAVVVGTSVGATIAFDLARSRPDLVRAVIGHESPWRVTRFAPTLPQISALVRMNWLSWRKRYPEAAEVFLRFVYTCRDGATSWEKFPEEWRSVARDNAEAALDDIRIAIKIYPSADELGTIKVPVACTCGARSRDTMLRVTRALSQVIPGATFHQIPGAGHAAPFDSPSHFAKLVREATEQNGARHVGTA